MLGLINKFNSPLAVTEDFGGVYNLYEGGKLAFVCTDGREFSVTTESGVYTPEKDGLLRVVELPLTDRHIKLG